jgi:hypothetical protein
MVQECPGLPGPENAIHGLPGQGARSRQNVPYLTHYIDLTRGDGEEALMTQMTTVDVLIIDDFALEPMNRDESRDIYQLFVERNARLPTIVSSNRDAAEWIATFDDALLAQSAVDRFKNNAFDFVVDGESYRPRLIPNIDKLGPPPSAPVRKPTNIIRRRKPNHHH